MKAEDAASVRERSQVRALELGPGLLLTVVLRAFERMQRVVVALA